MKPAFRITAAGRDVTATLQDRLLSLRVVDEDGLKADRLTLRLDDRGARLEFPETDVTLDLWLGADAKALGYVGQYKVDAVSGTVGPATMTINATAAGMTGSIRAPRSRAWEDVTLARIAQKIAANAGLIATVGPSLAAVHFPFLAQTAESDLHFLTRIARPLDATAKPAGGRLVVAKRGDGVNAAGDPIDPVAMSPAAWSSAEWELLEREVYKSVEAEWGDVDGGATRSITLGSGEPARKLRHVYASEAEARRAAKAELELAGRAVFKLTAQAAGYWPSLFAGGQLDLSGLRPELNGNWQIMRVEHALEAGLTTSIEARKGK